MRGGQAGQVMQVGGGLLAGLIGEQIARDKLFFCWLDERWSVGQGIMIMLSHQRKTVGVQSSRRSGERTKARLRIMVVLLIGRF